MSEFDLDTIRHLLAVMGLDSRFNIVETIHNDIYITVVVQHEFSEIPFNIDLDCSLF